MSGGLSTYCVLFILIGDIPIYGYVTQILSGPTLSGRECQGKILDLSRSISEANIVEIKFSGSVGNNTCYQACRPEFKSPASM